jgi:hypothetical protein
VDLNKRFLKGLTQTAKLRPNTKLRIPGPGGAVPAAEDEGLSWTMNGDVVGYRHWTFPDEQEQAINSTGVSYMMARPLHKAKPSKALKAGFIEVAEGSMLEQLRARLVDDPPRMTITRRG